MSYSPLTSYYVKSPNYDSRNGNKVQGFAIHCFVGQITVERGVNAFSYPRNASCNYVVGYDGKIGCALDDELRSWCTSNRYIDEKVLTIEMACDSYHPYKITDAAYDGLIKLLVDRCRAHGIKKLAWAADKAYANQYKLSEDYQNLVVHRWFDNKACPGDYIYNLHPQIVKDVNALLGQPEPKASPDFEAHGGKVWDALKAMVNGNEYAAAGLYGNLKAESGLIAGNLQNTFEKSLGMTDREYVAAVDAGTYKNFVTDKAGFGLAQWTYSTRKEKLKEYCDEHNASIGNETAQLGYLKEELTNDFSKLLEDLKYVRSVDDASDMVLLQFEKPADQSEANKERRRALCREAFDYYTEYTPAGGYCEVKARILGIDDEGYDVKTLQGALMAHGYDLEYCGGADGIFGEGTEEAVENYQRDHGLTVDGEVGSETWGSLLDEDGK